MRTGGLQESRVIVTRKFRLLVVLPPAVSRAAVRRGGRSVAHDTGVPQWKYAVREWCRSVVRGEMLQCEGRARHVARASGR